VPAIFLLSAKPNKMAEDRTVPGDFVKSSFVNQHWSFQREEKMAIEGAEIVKAAAFIGAGISMGLGAIGPGVGEGMVAAKACEAIGKNPKEAGLLTRTMLVGQAVSESTGIYSLVIALLLLFVV
jgi:F-type H+-transporting ATPase subunit c